MSSILVTWSLAYLIQRSHTIISYISHTFCIGRGELQLQPRWCAGQVGWTHFVSSPNSWILVQHINIWSWFHKFSLFSFSTLPRTQKLRLLPASFWPTASWSESGFWPELIHQQSSFWRVAPAHTATQHPVSSTLSIINNASQNQLSPVKKTF